MDAQEVRRTQVQVERDLQQPARPGAKTGIPGISQEAAGGNQGQPEKIARKEAINEERTWSPLVSARRGRNGRGTLVGRRTRGVSAKRQHQFQALGSEDHGHASGYPQGSPDDLPYHSHRYQPGDLWAGRGARWRHQELRPRIEEPDSQ